MSRVGKIIKSIKAEYMKSFDKFKRVDNKFIANHNLNFTSNVEIDRILMDFLSTYYNITFELGLCFVYSDKFNYYIGGSDDYYGYLKINKIWLSYKIYKSYVLKLNKVVKMLLKN